MDPKVFRVDTWGKKTIWELGLCQNFFFASTQGNNAHLHLCKVHLYQGLVKSVRRQYFCNVQLVKKSIIKAITYISQKDFRIECHYRHKVPPVLLHGKIYPLKNTGGEKWHIYIQGKCTILLSSTFTDRDEHLSKPWIQGHSWPHCPSQSQPQFVRLLDIRNCRSSSASAGSTSRPACAQMFLACFDISKFYLL